MKDIFAGLMLVAGAILIGAALIVNGSWVGIIGFFLLGLGLIERYVPTIVKFLKKEYQTDEQNEKQSQNDENQKQQ